MQESFERAYPFELADKLETEGNLTDDELKAVLLFDAPGFDEYLAGKARAVREKHYGKDREENRCKQRDLLEFLIQSSALRLLVEGITSGTAYNTHTLVISFLGHNQDDQCDANNDINTCKYYC